MDRGPANWELGLTRGAMAVFPVSALAFCVVLLAIPLRPFGGYVPVPLFPLMILFAVAVHAPRQLPALAVFAVGLFHSLLVGSAPGIWPVVYLVLLSLAYSQLEYLRGRAPQVVWFAFALAMIPVGAVLWSIQSILNGAALPVAGLALQLAITIAIFPLVQWAYLAAMRWGKARSAP